MTSILRLLVCGDRWWGRAEVDATPARKLAAELEKQLLETMLNGFKASYQKLIIIEGHAKGADLIAFDWAVMNYITPLDYPADWNKFGKGAGPVRNRQMLSEGKPDLVLACHNDLDWSKGTKDMCTIADEAGVPVFVLGRFSPEQLSLTPQL